jgi:FkbM family methyltransferase
MRFLRRVFNWLINYKRKVEINIHIADKEWREVCYKGSIPLNNVKLTVDNSLLLNLSNQQVIFPKNKASFALLVAYFRLNQLVVFTNCQISWDKNHESLALCWDNAIYLADNAEELDILYEIYMLGDYDYSSHISTVIVDIGANVGFTSIFLAETNKDIVIEACEPLKVNYEKALRNISQNSHLFQRINLHNFGLFSENGEQIIYTEQQNRGRSSIVIDRTLEPIGTVEKITIDVRRASSFVNEVKNRYPERKIVIKIDCEGSEYAILRNLQEDDVLRFINGFMMEWHTILDSQFNANYIRNFLADAGFSVYIRGRFQCNSTIGMAYAFKCSSDKYD